MRTDPLRAWRLVGLALLALGPVAWKLGSGLPEDTSSRGSITLDAIERAVAGPSERAHPWILAVGSSLLGDMVGEDQALERELETALGSRVELTREYSPCLDHESVRQLLRLLEEKRPDLVLIETTLLLERPRAPQASAPLLKLARWSRRRLEAMVKHPRQGPQHGTKGLTIERNAADRVTTARLWKLRRAESQTEAYRASAELVRELQRRGVRVALVEAPLSQMVVAHHGLAVAQRRKLAATLVSDRCFLCLDPALPDERFSDYRHLNRSGRDASLRWFALGIARLVSEPPAPGGS